MSCSVLVYHKDLSADERALVLRQFEEEGGVLVCTDAGARGIDISDVQHVVQVKLVVRFLHQRTHMLHFLHLPGESH